MHGPDRTAISRRTLLQLGVGTLLCGSWAGCRHSAAVLEEALQPEPPAASVIPVVGDGKWIWNRPPPGQTGFLEPRPFLLSVGIEMDSPGNAFEVKANTPVPVVCPEQKIDDEKVVADGCQAELRQVAPYARQLCLYAPQLAQGQKISAVANFKLTLYKQYMGYKLEQFPEQQPAPPADVRRTYLGESPGIQTRAKEVSQLAADLKSGLVHPWELARKFAGWITKNIRPQIGPFTGAQLALQTRRGDCAEMAAIFVALCRAVNIPARIVWVPNHNWSEFYLTDKDGKGHWLPVHTACYFWFGWTGAHELVIQKGDRIRVPEKRKFYRLLEDWIQYGGRKPIVRYTAELTPQPAKTGDDPGPGARKKMPGGGWKLVGKHPLDRYARP
jgi:hypothetical protein